MRVEGCVCDDDDDGGAHYGETRVVLRMDDVERSSESSFDLGGFRRSRNHFGGGAGWLLPWCSFRFGDGRGSGIVKKMRRMGWNGEVWDVGGLARPLRAVVDLEGILTEELFRLT